MPPSKSIAVHRGPAGRTVPTQFEDPITIGADGSILINTSKLGSPDNVYDADFAWLSVRHGAVSLWFGKESVDAPQILRSRLELRYPAESFVRHFWKNSREFYEKLAEIMKDLPAGVDRDDLRPDQWKAERDVSMWVNFDYLSRSGTQASLDFFHLPPSGLARFVQGQGSSGLVATAKVRVLTTVHEMFRLLRDSESIADDMKKRLPKPFVEDEQEKSE